jgi:hypothetical protein
MDLLINSRITELLRPHLNPELHHPELRRAIRGVGAGGS